MLSRPPPEKRPLAQLRAAGITLAVLRDVGCAGARGVQTADRAAVLAQHLPVDGHLQPAHRETGVHRPAQCQIKGRPRAVILCRHVFRLFVEVGVLAVGGVAVVTVQGRGEVSFRNSQCGLHLGDRLPTVDELDQRHLGHLHVGLVDDQIGRLLRLFEHESRRARMIGILGDESLAVGVDDDAGEQDLRRIGRGGDEQLVHVGGHPAGRDTQPDAQTIVVRIAQNVGRHHPVVLGLAFLAERGRVLSHHLGVHREAPRCDDDGRGFHLAGLAEVLPPHPDHRAVVVGDEAGRSGFIADLHPEIGGAFEQQVDHHRRATQLAGDRNRVPARRRLGLLAERPDLLVAGVGQSLGPRRDHDFARVVAALELKAQRLEPIEVLDAALAVGTDLVEFRVPRLRHQVLVHLLGRVLVSGGLLHCGATAEVEVAAGHRRRPAGRSGLLQDQDAGPCRCGADGRATTGDAESEDHHIRLVGPGRDLVNAHGFRDVLHGQFCSCLMWSKRA
ncbi:Uncharacterised protein [Mycolicibacterium vanbaalenii]|uniref:Uncharacterized protein n=1 Tax=Mycolicibacterium vanbaalenii TaxID=110539 RepID=A0A5S9QRB8_MYCVN|nr:Uncharacterised protein [Mycolicibacterium vanbaalenii]